MARSVAAADKAIRDAKAKGLETIEKFSVKNAKRNSVVLGNGSFGSVEQFEVDGVICAGKKVHAHLVQRGNQGQELMVKKYYDECCLLSDLRHPHVIQFLGICWIPDSKHPVLLMELLQGNLDDLLEKTPDVPLYLKVSILQDVARGLIYLHGRNPPVIHRDLNAGNVLLNTEMRAKIADVGNSRVVVDVQQAIKLSAIPGCPVYMPPEAFESPARYDTSLDMFSFGHLALFTATQVFPGDLKPIKDPNNKTKALSEVERRQEYIDILYAKVTGDEGASNKKGSAEVGTRMSEKGKAKIKDPPLVQFVKECLDDYGRNRPTAKLALKKLSDINAAVDNPYRGLSRLQLETSLAEKETRIQQQSSEIEHLKAQLQEESKKASSSHDAEVDLRSYAQKLEAENATLKAELQEAKQTRADLQRLFTMQEKTQKFTDQQMAEQHASKLVSLSMIYDDLMTNPNKGTILHQLEEQFEDKFDAKLVLGCIFMEAYDASKNHLNKLLGSIFQELYTVQPEESQGAEMESLSRAFSLMLNFAQVRSRLQHSSIQKTIREQITNKMITSEPSSRAKQPLDKINLRLDGVIDIAWRFVTEPNPLIVCQPAEFCDDLHDKHYGDWEEPMEWKFYLLYARPVVYSSYHGHILRRGFVGRVTNKYVM